MISAILNISAHVLPEMHRHVMNKMDDFLRGEEVAASGNAFTGHKLSLMRVRPPLLNVVLPLPFHPVIFRPSIPLMSMRRLRYFSLTLSSFITMALEVGSPRTTWMIVE